MLTAAKLINTHRGDVTLTDGTFSAADCPTCAYSVLLSCTFRNPAEPHSTEVTILTADRLHGWIGSADGDMVQVGGADLVPGPFRLSVYSKTQNAARSDVTAEVVR